MNGYTAVDNDSRTRFNYFASLTDPTIDSASDVISIQLSNIVKQVNSSGCRNCYNLESIIVCYDYGGTGSGTFTFRGSSFRECENLKEIKIYSPIGTTIDVDGYAFLEVPTEGDLYGYFDPRPDASSIGSTNWAPLAGWTFQSL